jgi:hypothetical protein
MGHGLNSRGRDVYGMLCCLEKARTTGDKGDIQRTSLSSMAGPGAPSPRGKVDIASGPRRSLDLAREDIR